MLPPESARRFMFRSWTWLLSGLGGFDAFREDAALVTPTETDFPVLPLDGQDLAEDYLGFVCEHAGCAEVPPLTADDAADAPPRAITYRAEWLDEPELLIAELAIAISAQQIEGLDDPPPAPEHLAAEVAAIHGGFGVFVANTVTRRHRTTLGPVETRRDILGERETAYGLAIFAWLSELPDARILELLHPNPAAFYRAAVRELRHRGSELDGLRAIRPPHRGPYR